MAKLQLTGTWYGSVSGGAQHNISALTPEYSQQVEMPLPAIRIRIEKKDGRPYLVFTGQDTEVWLEGAFNDFEFGQAAAELLGMLYTERNK
jgi:hypothetical protein